MRLLGEEGELRDLGGGGGVEHGSLNFNSKDKSTWFMHPAISLFINFYIPNCWVVCFEAISQVYSWNSILASTFYQKHIVCSPNE